MDPYYNNQYYGGQPPYPPNVHPSSYVPNNGYPSVPQAPGFNYNQSMSPSSYVPPPVTNMMHPQQQQHYAPQMYAPQYSPQNMANHAVNQATHGYVPSVPTHSTSAQHTQPGSSTAHSSTSKAKNIAHTVLSQSVAAEGRKHGIYGLERIL